MINPYLDEDFVPDHLDRVGLHLLPRVYEQDVVIAYELMVSAHVVHGGAVKLAVKHLKPSDCHKTATIGGFASALE